MPGGITRRETGETIDSVRGNVSDEAVASVSGRPETATESGEFVAFGAARRWRTIAWLAFGVVALVYAGALLYPMQGMARFFALEVVYTTPVSVSIALSLLAARISVGVERRFWMLLAAANATLVVCELLLVWWVLTISAQGPPRVSWPFQALHLFAAACFIGLVLSMSRIQDADASSRVRIALDLVALSIVVYVALLELYARPVMGNAPVSAVLVGAAYPLAGFMLLFGTLSNVVGFKFVKWRSWEMLVAVSIGVYAVAVSMWPAWYVTVTDTSRNLTRGALDLIQLTGHYLLLMAAVYRLSESSEWHLRPLPLPAGARRPWLTVVLPGLSLIAIPSLLYAALSQHGANGWFTAYATLATILIAAVFARSLVLTLEHGALFHSSVTDPLTGLYNHRFFHDRLNVELSRARRYGDELSVIVIDVDDFGGYNTAFGHMAGDVLLSGLGAKLLRTCAPPVICARLGGDEFGVIVPEADVTQARLIAQRIVDIVGIECGDTPGTLSASAGVASYPEHSSTAAELVRLADGALFHAKETGKARVVPFEASAVPDLSAKERISRLERQSRLSAVRALAAAVDARDPATRFHSQQVAVLAKDVARALNLDDAHVRLVELAALLHDVGKIGVADSILNKPTELTDAEWAEIRQHSIRGEDILRSTDLVEILSWVRGHHERWDGSGYPDRLKGASIPLESRILAVCDSYDAMTSDRAYRAAMNQEDAISELAGASGTQFDPVVVNALLAVLSKRSQAAEK